MQEMIHATKRRLQEWQFPAVRGWLRRMLLRRHPSRRRAQQRSCSVPSPDPWHETIPDSYRIVAVAGKLRQESAVFECSTQDMECYASRDGNEAQPGTHT